MHDQENCLIRPRYNGYVPMQEDAGLPLQQFLLGEASADRTWKEINDRYRASRRQPGR